jgi:hypothetical protein
MTNLINWTRMAENALVQYKAEVRNPSPIVLAVLNEFLLTRVETHAKSQVQTTDASRV